MRSKKDSKKLKVTLLVINLALLAAVAWVGLFCYQMIQSEKTEPKLDYAYEVSLLEKREAELDAKISDQQKLLAADLTSEAHLQQKQSIEQQMEQIRTEMTDLNAQKEVQVQMLSDLQDPERMKLLIEEVRTEYGQHVRQLEDMINDRYSEDDKRGGHERKPADDDDTAVYERIKSVT